MPQFLVEEVIAETCDETSVMGEHHITIILQGCLEELLKVLKNPEMYNGNIRGNIFLQ